MRAFHYLLESFPGVLECPWVHQQIVEVNLSSHKSLGATSEELITRLNIDDRDQRVLVVVDGELLWESLPKNGECLHTQFLDTIYAPIEYLRKPRFGDPSYRVIEVEESKKVACFDIERHFLLLPAGNFVFRRVRDLRSLGPAYVMGEVSKSKGKNSVVWRNSTY